MNEKNLQQEILDRKILLIVKDDTKVFLSKHKEHKYKYGKIIVEKAALIPFVGKKVFIKVYESEEENIRENRKIIAHTLSRATAEMLKEVEKMKKVSMICSICGEEDKSKTAYCEKHHRSPHLLIEVVDMQDIRRRLRTQSGSFSLPKEKLAKENKDGGGK